MRLRKNIFYIIIADAPKKIRTSCLKSKLYFLPLQLSLFDVGLFLMPSLIDSISNVVKSNTGLYRGRDVSIRIYLYFQKAA